MSKSVCKKVIWLAVRLGSLLVKKVCTGALGWAVPEPCKEEEGDSGLWPQSSFILYHQD